MGQNCTTNREITIQVYRGSQPNQFYRYQSNNNPPERQLQIQNRQIIFFQQETPLDRFNRFLTQGFEDFPSDDEQNNEENNEDDDDYKFQKNDDSDNQQNSDSDNDNDGLQFNSKNEQLEQLKFQLEMLNQLLNNLKTLQQQQQLLEDESYADKLEINISLFYKRKHAQTIDSSCQHAECSTIVFMNSQGIVNCKNGCPSFKIKDAEFDISKNQIFSKYRQNKVGHFVSIQSSIEMAQILQDSIVKSKMNEQQRDEFCKNFTKVLCFQFFKSQKQQ